MQRIGAENYNTNQNRDQIHRTSEKIHSIKGSINLKWPYRLLDETESTSAMFVSQITRTNYLSLSC